MNAKENVLRIIRFDQPERVVSEPPVHSIAYHGCNHEGYEGGGHDLPVGSSWRDIWGTTWVKEQEGVMGFPRGHPLSDLRALRTFRWPDPDDERICAAIYQRAQGYDRAETFLCGSHRDTLWEKSYMLVGMENVMCAFYADPGAVREVLHRIMDFQLGIARHYLALGVELVRMGDDLGTQRGLLLSPQIVEEFLVPEYRRLFDLYREHGVLVLFHSCGHIEPMLETFMNLGVDVLNPVQASANDLGCVRERTQGRMALQGGISSALIMDGPVEAIGREVARRIAELGHHGGYFCGPDQGLPFPDAHRQALDAAIDEFGRYPLQPGFRPIPQR